MNERIYELMKEAGYAAPELAGRAQRLTELIINECAKRLDELEDAVFVYKLGSDTGYSKAELIKKDRKSTRLNSSHIPLSRMPSSA